MRRIERRSFLCLAGAVLVIRGALAQTAPGRNYVVGVLIYETQADFEPALLPFKEGLRQAGLVEGQNLRFVYRYADYDHFKINRLASELVRAKVDVIYAPQPWAVRGAQAATKTVPIVFSEVNDPVGGGFVQSLARPGGNTTGIAISGNELVEKRVQLMRDMFPRAKRFAVMYDQDAAEACRLELEDIRAAGKKLNIDLYEYPYGNSKSLKDTFEQARQDDIAAALVPTTYEARRSGHEILARASDQRLPMIHEAAQAGALMSYGPELGWAPRRAADYVARILRGTRPADLPVERAARYELVINSGVARSIGVEIPPAVRLSADRVIQ